MSEVAGAGPSGRERRGEQALEARAPAQAVPVVREVEVAERERVERVGRGPQEEHLEARDCLVVLAERGGADGERQGVVEVEALGRRDVGALEARARAVARGGGTSCTAGYW